MLLKKKKKAGEGGGEQCSQDLFGIPKNRKPAAISHFAQSKTWTRYNSLKVPPLPLRFSLTSTPLLTVLWRTDQHTFLKYTKNALSPRASPHPCSPLYQYSQGLPPGLCSNVTFSEKVTMTIHLKCKPHNTHTHQLPGPLRSLFPP